MRAGLPGGSRCGSAAIELAFSLLFVLIPLLGVTVDWGWYFYRQLLVTNAVRDGVRVGVMVDTSFRASVAEHWITTRLENAGFTADEDFSDSDLDVTNDTDAQTLTVSVTVDYKHLVSILPVGPPDELAVTYTMPYQ